jgi:preprotein translocase subunit Sss1
MANFIPSPFSRRPTEGSASLSGVKDLVKAGVEAYTAPAVWLHSKVTDEDEETEILGEHAPAASAGAKKTSADSDVRESSSPVSALEAYWESGLEASSAPARVSATSATPMSTELSTGMKVGIGLGILTIVGLVGFTAYRSF